MPPTRPKGSIAKGFRVQSSGFRLGRTREHAWSRTGMERWSGRRIGRQGLPDGAAEHLRQADNGEGRDPTKNAKRYRAYCNVQDAGWTIAGNDRPQPATDRAQGRAASGSDDNRPAQALPPAKLRGGSKIIRLRTNEAACQVLSEVITGPVADFAQARPDHIAGDVAEYGRGQEHNRGYCNRCQREPPLQGQQKIGRA